MIFFFFLLLSSFAYGSSPEISLDADMAYFDEATDAFFGRSVRLSLTDGSNFICHRGEFHPNQKKGTFKGGGKEPQVIYQGRIQNELLEVRGDEMAIELDQDYWIVTAENQVSIDWEGNYACSADRATYRFEKENKEEGVLHLIGESPRTPCLVKTPDGNWLEGEEVWVDFKERQAVVHQPVTEIYISGDHPQFIRAMGKTLTWKEIDSVATLVENVRFTSREWGSITADAAAIEYEPQTQTPRRVTIKGNVCLHNRYTDAKQGNRQCNQFALADVVIYYPEEKKLVMTATTRKRVLFCDRENQIEASAPQLTMIVGERLGQESVRGAGDVKFSFGELEWKELKQYFPSIR